MFEEHAQIVLTSDLPDEGLKAGDVGTIVHIHRQGEAFEVEFSALEGKTIAVATALASQVRPVTDKDVIHARPMELPV
jgi:hypothetical protein